MQSRAATSGASHKPRCLPFARCFWNVAVLSSFQRTVLPPTFLKVSRAPLFSRRGALPCRDAGRRGFAFRPEVHLVAARRAPSARKFVVSQGVGVPREVRGHQCVARQAFARLA